MCPYPPSGELQPLSPSSKMLLWCVFTLLLSGVCTLRASWRRGRLLQRSCCKQSDAPEKKCATRAVKIARRSGLSGSASTRSLVLSIARRYSESFVRLETCPCKSSCPRHYSLEATVTDASLAIKLRSPRPAPKPLKLALRSKEDF